MSKTIYNIPGSDQIQSLKSLQNVTNNYQSNALLFGKSWKIKNPYNAAAIEASLGIDISTLSDIDAKEIANSFSCMSNTYNITDWTFIKSFMLEKIRNMVDNLGESQVISIFETQIKEEIKLTKFKESNTVAYICLSWLKEFLQRHVHDKSHTNISQSERDFTTSFDKEFLDKHYNMIYKPCNLIMFCKNCGKQITEDSAFCQFCGKKQDIVNHDTFKFIHIENKTNIITHDTPKSNKLQQFCSRYFNLILTYSIWLILNVLLLLNGHGRDGFWPYIYTYRETIWERNYLGESLGIGRPGSEKIECDWDIDRYGFSEFIIYVILIPLLVYVAYQTYNIIRNISRNNPRKPIKPDYDSIRNTW